MTNNEILAKIKKSFYWEGVFADKKQEENAISFEILSALQQKDQQTIAVLDGLKEELKESKYPCCENGCGCHACSRVDAVNGALRFVKDLIDQKKKELKNDNN